MIEMRFHVFRFAFMAATTFIFASRSQAGDSCASGLTICVPPGATSDSAPQIGNSAFQGLFEDILLSSLPSSSKRASSAAPASLCCRTSLSCVLMANLNIPFCYDKFTTNYFLPDGSYGTVVSGAYNSSSGDLANLISGRYTLVNGSTGNIYSEVSAPNTSTLPMPSQYTASGVGSAIPASALGNRITITYTTTSPGTTIPPSTIPASILPASITAETVMLLTTVATEISGFLVAATSAMAVLSTATLPGSTISGSTKAGTTIPPLVTIVTTTEQGPTLTSASSTEAKKNGSSDIKFPWITASLLGVGITAFFKFSH